MRIGINAFGLHATSGGVANHVFNILRLWPVCYPNDELSLFCDRPGADLFASFGMENKVRIELLDSLDGVRDWVPWLDVYFCPAGVLSPFPLYVPSVLGLADIQERFFPSYFDKEDLRFRLFHYDWSAHLADRVITVSDFSKRSIVALMQVPETKIDRIYHCPDELPIDCLRPRELPQSGFEAFAFYPGNNWAHKNHDRLLKAIRMAKDNGCRIPLVLTGTSLENGYDIAYNASELGIADQVCHLGRVSRAELSWLYRNADCLAFASEFEGFGIPVIEARSVGLPVLRGDHTSLPEAGTAGDCLCDVQSVKSISGGLTRLFEMDAPKDGRCNQEMGSVFSESSFTHSHRAVFVSAIDEFRPWKTGWKDRIRKRYRLRRGLELSDWDRTEATKLLQEAGPD